MTVTLADMRQVFRQSGALAVSAQQQAQILAGICAMEGIWSHYPTRHMEACYDKEMLALYRQTTAIIEQKARDADQRHGHKCHG